MANQLRVTGNDIIQIGYQSKADNALTTIESFADGDYARVTFPNDIMNFTIGKNRNMLAAYNALGNLAELELRLLRGSTEDKFLNENFPRFSTDAPDFNFLKVIIQKDLGVVDKSGEKQKIEEKYTLNNGIISKAPEIISNVSGSTDQGVVVWQIRFAEFKREVNNTFDGAEGLPSNEGTGGTETP